MKSLSVFLRNVCIMVALTSGLVACQHEVQMQSPADLQPEPASLTFTVALPKATVTTRAGYADVDEDWENATGWSDWDKLVDGRMFYRVTVFLIDSDNRLVGFRDLYKGNDHLCEHNGFLDADGDVDIGLEFSEKVRVSFLYDTPKHGDIEKLHRGKYRLMAVANYSKYEDLRDNLRVGYQDNLTTFANQIKDIEEDFINNKGDVGIENFTETSFPDFFNARFDAGTDRICPKNPQPLTLVMDVNLQPGDNEVEGELVRTYSRIRIEVENNANHEKEDLELTVANLTFSNNFAQRYAYLFSDPDDEDRNYTGMGRGAMTITSDEAITPFVAGTKISELDTDNSSNSNDKIIFDAYILESKDETNDYTYTLDLRYEECEETTTEVTYTAENTAITDFKDLTDEGYYLIRRNDENQYLTAGINTVEVVVENKFPAAPEETLVWQLEKHNRDEQYYIKTTGKTAYYVLNPTTTEITLGATKGAYFTFSNSNNKIRMQSSGSSQRYVTIDGTAKGSNWGSGKNANNNPRLFYFYKVTSAKKETVTVPQKQEEIILKTIDPETAQVSEVTNIKRNDFVNVLVTVSYTPTSNNGYFTFEVAPWVKKHDNYIEYE